LGAYYGAPILLEISEPEFNPIDSGQSDAAALGMSYRQIECPGHSTTGAAPYDPATRGASMIISTEEHDAPPPSIPP